MKKLEIVKKLRELRCSLSRPKPPARPRPVTRLNATARRMAPSALDDYDDDQPTTKLSSAFVVVLILHLVAVGGIVAFKGIKAHRLSRELPVASATARTGSARVATAEAPTEATTIAPAHVASTPAAQSQRVYKAHGGETLAKVASLQGVGTAELAQYNGLSQSAVLRPNQTIVIPQGKSTKPVTQTSQSSQATSSSPSTSPDVRKAFLDAHKDDTALLAKTAPPKAAAATKPGTKTYTVTKNDTVTSIAKKHGVTADALMKLNKIDDPKKLQLNQQLTIPARKGE